MSSLVKRSRIRPTFITADRAHSLNVSLVFIAICCIASSRSRIASNSVFCSVGTRYQQFEMAHFGLKVFDACFKFFNNAHKVAHFDL